ncbi:phage tail tube protein [Advenella mandrilli]|nr:phage tail tube protein [Advenella mandrilli]
MTAMVGRKVTFTPTAGGTAIMGMKTKTMTMNNEPIDITSDDDDGWTTFLGTDPAVRSMEMSVEGVAKDDTLIKLALGAGGALVSDYELNFPGWGKVSGDFHIGSVELGAPHNEAVTFSATITSSGELTYTPETP